MKKLITIALILNILVISAQNSSSPLQNLQGPSSTNVDQQTFDAINSRGQWRPISIDNKIDGTPLVLEGNKNQLVIYTNDNNIYKISNGNYNSKSDQLVSEYTKDSIYTFGNQNIKYAKLNNQIVRKFKSEDSKERFYFILSQGEKISFLKGYHSRIMEGTINVMTKQKVSSDKYIIYENYYFSKDNKSAIKFKLKKKDILKFINKNKKEVESYVKKNNLSYKKEMDVIEIIKYYNSL